MSNPAALLHNWLERALPYAHQAEVDARSRQASALRFVEDVWRDLWDLDADLPTNSVEYLRRSMAMIETGQQVRLRAERSGTSFARVALEHFHEVESALSCLMIPRFKIVEQMGRMKATSWQSLRFLSSVFEAENGAEPDVDLASIDQHLSEVQDLIRSVLADDSLAGDLKTFLLDRLDEVHDALIDATVQGASAVRRARDSLYGSRHLDRDYWDRIAQTKWAPRVGKMWAALLMTLGAAGGLPALLPNDEPKPIQSTVVVVSGDKPESDDVVDAELVDNPTDGDAR